MYSNAEFAAKRTIIQWSNQVYPFDHPVVYLTSFYSLVTVVTEHTTSFLAS